MEENKIIYAGIGSRETPGIILDRMITIAARLSKKGYLLRSGGAVGADKAFAMGAIAGYCEKRAQADFDETKPRPHTAEIWLPWEGYKHVLMPGETLHYPSTADWALASRHHPNWFQLSQKAKALHARNGPIIVGADHNTPVDFVVCWTKDGKASGGTGQGLRIAKDRGIPIYNLFNFGVDRDELIC